jgi:NAD(P)-dependent dehydrogenase (short-subunit alcohol dehydrogenase family)
VVSEGRNAVVLGAERPFGAQIVARLQADGLAVATALEGAGAIDVLVVNVPPQPSETRFRELGDGAFLAALDDQLFDPAAACQAAAARIRSAGSIVLVASRAHLGGWAGADTIAAGAALIGLSRSLALEFAAMGVRVNLLAPDFAGQPWDTPEARTEIAGAVAWLAGPDSAAMSGETLLLDRGKTLRMNEAGRR